jgi:hypothetical protein
MHKNGMGENKASGNAPATSPTKTVPKAKLHSEEAAAAAIAALEAKQSQSAGGKEQETSPGGTAARGESAPKKRRKVNHGMTRPPRCVASQRLPGAG